MEAWKAWVYLRQFRQANGMCIAALSYTDYSKYAEDLGLEGEKKIWFIGLINRVDTVYITHQTSKKPKQDTP